MLKWKTQAIVISVAGSEVTQDVLGYQAGKNRTIKFITGTNLASLTLRAYRTAEQVVDLDTVLMTTGDPLIPLDIVLKEGDTFKAGFKDNGAGAATYSLAIGYTESD